MAICKGLGGKMLVLTITPDEGANCPKKHNCNNNKITLRTWWSFIKLWTCYFLVWFVTILLSFMHDIYSSHKVAYGKISLRHIIRSSNKALCWSSKRSAGRGPGPESSCGSAGGPEEENIRHHKCIRRHQTHYQEVQE